MRFETKAGENSPLGVIINCCALYAGSSRIIHCRRHDSARSAVCVITPYVNDAELCMLENEINEYRLGANSDRPRQNITNMHISPH